MKKDPYSGLMRDERWFVNLAIVAVISASAFQMYLSWNYRPTAEDLFEIGYSGGGFPVQSEVGIFIAMFVVFALQTGLAGSLNMPWIYQLGISKELVPVVVKRLLRTLSLILLLISIYMWLGVLERQGWVPAPVVTGVLVGGAVLIGVWLIYSMISLRQRSNSNRAWNGGLSEPGWGGNQRGSAWKSNDKDPRGPFL